MFDKFMFVAGLCLLAAGVAEARGVFVDDAMAFTYGGDQLTEDQSYEQGTKAMNDGHWAEAEKAFRYTAGLQGKRADGAIYWQAYLQNKQGHPRQAVRTCETLTARYAQSKWSSECGALTMMTLTRADVTMGSDGNDASDSESDIKMLALNGLMQQQPERALPMVKSILQSSTQSQKLKERALFVLTQSQSKEAQDVLDSIARGKLDPDLQVKAIQMMAAMKGAEAAGFLNEMYRNASNEKVRDAAINGMFISGDSKDLIKIARAENNPELKKKIVSKLALMNSKEVTDYMVELLNK